MSNFRKILLALSLAMLVLLLFLDTSKISYFIILGIAAIAIITFSTYKYLLEKFTKDYESRKLDLVQMK